MWMESVLAVALAVAPAPDRELKFDGVFNARDLGGLPTASGQTTRFRSLVRSDAPNFLTEAGWRAVHDYGIRTIIDLRNPSERKPDLAPRPADITTISLPLDGLEDKAFWKVWGKGALSSTPAYYKAHLEQLPALSARVLGAIAHAKPGGVMFHCIAGRDRTGLITLLVLALAGVPPDAIAADHGLSVKNMPAVMARIGQAGQQKKVDAFLAERGKTVEQMVLETLAQVDVVRQLKAGGLSDAEIQAVHERLVGPGAPEHVRSTAHFDVVWQADKDARPDEVERICGKAERWHDQLAAFLGPDHTPGTRIRIVLGGEGYTPGKTPELPHVDDAGVVTLYRFPGPGGIYEASLLHELVHAFRFVTMLAKGRRIDPGFGFVEEGFAEHVALSIEPVEIGFSLYNYPLDVVVGHWLTTGPELDLGVIGWHHELNRPCLAQAYPLRASFMKYLETTFGRAKLIELAYAEPIVTETYPRLFGRSFATLVTEWRAWALRRFQGLAGGPRLAAEYAAQTPIAYFPLCTFDGKRLPARLPPHK